MNVILIMYYYIKIHLALFFLLTYFKHRVNKWSKEKKDDALGASMQVINRPLAVSLIIVLLMTPIFYPEAPQIATRLIYLFSIIPIVYLLPALIPHIPKRYVYLFGALFLVSEAAFFSEKYYVLDRITLLVFDMLAIAIIIYCVRIILLFYL